MCKPLIEIKRADNTSALSDFRCGVKSMDDFIHDKKNGLAKFIEYGLSNLWLVYEGEKVVAFFALSKDVLILNTNDAHNILEDENLSSLLPQENETKFWDHDKFPAIEIDYLAVCEEKRNKHLGTALVNKIVDFAAQDSLSATKFITVEALDTNEYSAVKFYKEHCDFELSDYGIVQNENKVRDGERPTTRLMYRIVIPSTINIGNKVTS